MKKIIFVVLLLFALVKVPAFAQSTASQTVYPEFFKANITNVKSITKQSNGGTTTYYGTLEIKILEGSDKGKIITVNNEEMGPNSLTKAGQGIIVSRTIAPNGKKYYSFYDTYRLNNLIICLIIFFIAILLIAGLKGLGSISGMIISLAVILIYIVPSIIAGQDPLTVTLLGSIVILLTTTYLAHGISRKTTIALVSTLISLLLTAAFAKVAVDFNHITGLGNEDFYNLLIGTTKIINIKGLFLSAIIISTLGALNDITTTQSATILELKIANPKLKFLNLFEKGLAVGREHIASLVNTLVLAYVGSAFAVFIFLVLNPSKTPYWVILNNEIVSDEIVRIIAGSMGLLLSVPIVTFLASYIFSKIKN